MSMAVRWATASSLDKVLICSDNQSLLCAVVSGADSDVDIINLIQQSPTDIHIQWVPGHCGIPGNELADHHAKQAPAIKDDPLHPITLSNAVTAVKQLIRDTAPTHGRTKAVYNQYSERRDSAEISSQKDVIMLAQLCSSHSNLVRAGIPTGHRLLGQSNVPEVW